MAISDEQLEFIKSHSGIEVDGKFIQQADIGSPSAYGGSADDVAAIQYSFVSGSPLYRKEGGGYTTTMPRKDSATGAITTAPEKIAGVSFDFNKETGDISVKAPREYLESDYWKGNDDLGITGYKQYLEDLSQMYKLNPEYELEMVANDGEKKSQSVQKWIEEMASEFAEQTVPSYLNFVSEKKKFDNKYGVSFTDSEFLIATNSLFSDSSDTALTSIPLYIGEKYFKDSGGYTETDGYAVVTKQALLEDLWNREKYSEDELKDEYASLQQDADYLAKLINRWSSGTASDDPDVQAKIAGWKKQLAADVALMNSMETLDPTMIPIRRFGDVIRNIFEGAQYGTVTAIERFAGANMDLIGKVLGLNNVDERALGGVSEDAKGLSSLGASAFQAAKEADAEYSTILAEHNLLDRDAASKGVLAYGLGSFAGTIALSVLEGKVVSSAATSVLNGIFDTFSLVKGTAVIEGAAEGAALISDASIDAGTLVSTTSTFEKLLTTEQLSTLIGNAIEWVKIADSSRRYVNITATTLSSLPRVQQVISTVGSLLNFVGTSFIGGAITSPDTYHRLMASDTLSEEDKAFLAREFVSNAAFLGAGIAVSKGAVTFSKTAAGQKINAAASKYMAKARNFFHGINENITQWASDLKSSVTGKPADIASKFEEAVSARDAASTGSHAWNKLNRAAKNAQYGLQRTVQKQMVDIAQAQLAGAKGIQASKAAKQAIREAEVAMDRINAGSDTYFNAMLSPINPDLSDNLKMSVAQYSDMLSKVSGLYTSAEKGLKTKISTKATGISESDLYRLPQKVSNYIGAKNDLKIVLNNLAVDLTGSANGAKMISFDLTNKYPTQSMGYYSFAEGTTLSLGDINRLAPEKAKQIEKDLAFRDAFLGEATPEAVAAADKFANQLPKTYSRLTTVQRYGITGDGSYGTLGRGGIINDTEYTALVESGRWGELGEDYVHLQRIKPSKTPLDTRMVSDRAYDPADFEKRVWGATEDFEDPLITLIDYMSDMAYKMSRNDFMQVQKGLMPGMFSNVVVTPEQSVAANLAKYSREVRPIVSSVIDDLAFGKGTLAQDTMPQIVDSLAPKETIDKMLYGAKAKQEAKSAKAVFDAAEKKALKVETTSTERMNFLTEMSLEERIQAAESLVDDYLITYRGQSGLDDFHWNDTYGDSPNLMKDNPWTASTPEAAQEYGEDVLVVPIKKTSILPYTEANNLEIEARRLIREGKISSDNLYKIILELAGPQYKAVESLHPYIYGMVEYVIPEGDINGFFAESQMLLAETPRVREMAKLSKANTQLAEAKTIYERTLNGLQDLLGDIPVESPEIIASVDDTTNMLVQSIRDSKNGLLDGVFNAPYGVEEIGQRGAISEYYTIQYLRNNWNATGKDFSKSIRKQLEEGIGQNIKKRLGDAARGDKTIPYTNVKKAEATADKLAKHYVELMRDNLDSRYGTVSRLLETYGSSIPQNDPDIFAELQDLVADVTGAKTDPYTIGMTDGTIVKVDPIIADFYNYRNIVADQNTLARARKFQAAVFRLGTTGINPKSMVSQYCKDPISAFVNGGMWRGVKSTSAAIRTEFGDEIANFVEKFEPSVSQYYKDMFGEGTEAYMQALAGREAEIGKYININNREYTLYEFGRQNKLAKMEAEGRYTRDRFRGGMQKFKDGVDNVIEILEKPNEWRESALRRGVRAQGIYDALKEGYTLQQARDFGEFTMNNATTNFSHLLTHLHNLASSTPYFTSAVNGVNSFWRMVELDPVGIMGRMIAGLILPAVYLTVNNLGSEENRKVYENIPEWERASSLIILVNGQKYTVPMPEQLVALISPWRQIVEGLYGAAADDFWKLALNDLVAFSPVDLKGFVNADSQDLLANDFLSSHIIPGISRAGGQMLSPVEKSILMMATGYDPYTNKPIYQGYQYYDPLTGEVQIMDYTSTELSRAIAGIFGKDTSPAMAQKILETLFGVGNVGVINGVIGLANSVVSGNVGDYIGETSAGLTNYILSPLYGETYDRAKSEFSLAIRKLQSQKNELLQNTEIQTYLTVLYSNSASEVDKSNARAKVKDTINAFYQDVLDATNAYQEKFGLGLTKSQFASVLSLMNLETGSNMNSLLSAISDYAAEIDSKQYYAGRTNAVQTMQAMGFSGISDSSIFGYITTTSDGKVRVEYSSPLAILALEQTQYSQGDVNLNNIKTLIKSSGLATEEKAIDTQINAIYGSKKKLSSADYNKIDAIRIQWNAHVMSVLSPYINEVSAENVLRNTDTINEIAKYIKVPTSGLGYVKNKNTAIKGSTQQAYVRNYIKYIFQVNDTGWEGGAGDFSGRSK